MGARLEKDQSETLAVVQVENNITLNQGGSRKVGKKQMKQGTWEAEMTDPGD